MDKDKNPKNIVMISLLLIFFLLLFYPRLFAFFGEGEANVTDKLEKGGGYSDTSSEGETIKGPHLEYTAHNLRDPFEDILAKRTEEQKRKTQTETPAASSPPALIVQGLVWGGVIPQAIINGKVVKKGDMLEGAEIGEIGKDGVTVSYNNQTYKLSSPVPVTKSTDKQEVIR